MAGGKGGTTSGHGIFSQYRPEHMKQWILGESKSQRGRSEFGSKSLRELRELTKTNESESYKRIPDSADFLASTSGPLDVSNTSGDLFGDKTWAAGQQVGPPPPGPGSEETLSKEERKDFLSLPPHLVHHHHFGWQHSQNDQERIVGTLSNRESYRKYGDAMSYCQLINTKHSLISTRKS
ncbi:hypothetical protein HOP50_14g72350 [Chloropicon primus]|uniref:Uncharacterized protein n=1 Tax=Chloropicon primus TaxID=1764295 RepID=A0A5B8MVY5_9CHLO|nr:hypothetical protein A3770_14p72170 [Chloropicon primus]UPR03905.1 hypothetical protein HOP50_14g72350 [Chloropicon primus]|eukprot:QDZ24699.1 hypothetical protein A3770_14p72170 [Chloropicon primus]